MVISIQTSSEREIPLAGREICAKRVDQIGRISDAPE